MRRKKRLRRTRRTRRIRRRCDLDLHLPLAMIKSVVSALGRPSTALWAMIKCSIFSGPTFNGLLGCDQVQYLLWADLQRPFGL